MTPDATYYDETLRQHINSGALAENGRKARPQLSNAGILGKLLSLPLIRWKWSATERLDAAQSQRLQRTPRANKGPCSSGTRNVVVT